MWTILKSFADSSSPAFTDGGLNTAIKVRQTRVTICDGKSAQVMMPILAALKVSVNPMAVNDGRTILRSNYVSNAHVGVCALQM